MTFNSILFNKYHDSPKNASLKTEPPDFFVDLNLDQIVNAVTVGKEEYDLKTFFYTSLHDVIGIIYRQEIMRDMENIMLFNHIKLFAQNMRAMRDHLPKQEKYYYKYQKERLFLDSVEIYCHAIDMLTHNLFRIDLKSPGLLGFREYLKNHMNSVHFTSLLSETKNLIGDLASIKYGVLTKGLTVRVLSYKAESDYGEEVEQIFDRFKQDAVKDYRTVYHPTQDMNHVEAQILEGVASLYPDFFQRLEDYFAKNANYLDETIAVFDREVQFYVAYLDHIAKLKKLGLNFCYPEISDTDKNIYDLEGFDLALAHKLFKENSPVVSNDFYLKGKERIIVVTGPNQGGKTTFSRFFGQLHYLTCLGCLVPGKEAKLFVPDKLFTHFEKEENMQDHRSKLEDDLVRIHHILEQSSPNSIIIMNEILSSTTLQDAIFLSKKIMEKITDLDLLCVWVTFIDELTLFSKKNVSMVSKVETKDSALRTFKIERSPADGLAYALSIAKKYKVTYTDLKKRIKS
jgi:hypothetical protein